jgi:hypothetical protein
LWFFWVVGFKQEEKKVEAKESMRMLPKVKKGRKRIKPLERENNVRAAIGFIRDWEELILTWVHAMRAILLEQVMVELHERDEIQ